MKVPFAVPLAVPLVVPLTVTLALLMALSLKLSLTPLHTLFASSLHPLCISYAPGAI